MFNRKFSDKIQIFERFIVTALSVIEIVSVPPSPYPDEEEIRDVHDRPILRAAIKAEATFLLTGDKDFLDSGIRNPKILTAAEFLQMN